jgi:hypothetical protein
MKNCEMQLAGPCVRERRAGCRDKDQGLVLSSPTVSSGKAALYHRRSGHRSASDPTLGRREGDFMRQENWIRGNTRTVIRQYAARKLASVRLLPGIAGYCRVVGPCEFGRRSAECGVRAGEACSHRTGRTGYPDIPVGAYGPHKSAWDRLGPLKFFSPRKSGEENRCEGLWSGFAGTQSVGGLSGRAPCRFGKMGRWTELGESKMAGDSDKLA